MSLDFWFLVFLIVVLTWNCGIMWAKIKRLERENEAKDVVG